MSRDDSSSKHCLVPPGSRDHEAVGLSLAATAPPTPHPERHASGVYVSPAGVSERPLAAERGQDQELLGAVRAGEADAGERLYDELIGSVDRAIVRVLGAGQPEHDDLVQATFEQLVTTLVEGRFRHECSLRSWASSIASHLALNAIRSRRRERAMFDPKLSIHHEGFSSAAPACTERDVEARRKLLRLRQELASMNEERAHALVLHHVLGHDLKEVARLLGISVTAAQSRVNRGKHELQRRMQRAEGGDDD